MPRKKKAEVKLEDDSLPLDSTSSLNNYYMCVCNERFTQKDTLAKHVSKCTLKYGKPKKLVCSWCQLEFINRGNLINHAYHMHGDKKIVNAAYKCDVCDARFTEKWKIKFHVRRDHFNLWARIPHANTKQVNQVWFEKVLNTNLVMQIKKTGNNRLIMKPTPPNADLEIHGTEKMVDLRNQYPFIRCRQKVQCKLCGKMYSKVDLKKHLNERHFNVAKHKCNNCNKTFKRSYIYLQHVCHKGKKSRRPKIRGVKHVQNSSIRITSVDSLKSVVIE